MAAELAEALVIAGVGILAVSVAGALIVILCALPWKRDW